MEGTNTPTSTGASCPGIPAPEQPIDIPIPIVDESSGPIGSSVGTPSAFHSTPRPPPGSRNIKNRSEVWSHFTKVPDCDPKEPIGLVIIVIGNGNAIPKGKALRP